MNLRKIITLILTISIITLIFSSCTSEISYIDDETDEEPLRIYLPAFDMANKDDIYYYNKIKPKESRPIEITEFKVDTIEDIGDMYTQILNEMSVGKGPDIIVINWQTDYFIDIHKIAKQNTFADMNILIENSKDFDFNDYNKSVLDAGIIDNKRVLMPLTYKVEYLIGVEECFKNNNLEIPKELTLDSYCDLLEEYYKKIANKTAMLYIGHISHMLDMDTIYLLSEFFEYGKPVEKTDQLQRLFELLKIENKRFIEPNKKSYTKEDFLDYYNNFISNNYLFLKSVNFGWNQYRRLHENYNIIENKYQSNIIVFKQPLGKDNPTKSYVQSGLAININSKHKNEAFKFVQFMLSKGVQSDTLNTIDLPVNKESYKDEIANFDDGFKGIVSTYLDINESKMPEKMKNDFIEYVESAKTCEYIGQFEYIYHNVINQSIEDYYNDKLTFDEMIDEINNKLSIYYSE